MLYSRIRRAWPLFNVGSVVAPRSRCGDRSRFVPSGAALTPSPPFPSPVSCPDRPKDLHPAQRRLFDVLAGDQRTLGQAPLTVATAESCTGGEISHRIVEIAGSSAYFLGGVVAYANSAKASLLGVPPDVLDNPGAVSDVCARSMAEGARRAFGADLAVATTGIAGPGGGTARKPVGLVFIAVSGPAGTIVTEHRFPGDRHAIIAATATAALELLVDSAEQAVNQGATTS